MEHLEHFGLKQDPFQNNPQLAFYFASPQHTDAERRLLRGVRQGKGLSVIVGASGSGKTTLVSHLMEGLDEDAFEASLIVMVHTGVDSKWLLACIARQLGVEEPAATRVALVGQIYRQLVAIREEGRRPVVVIDEAQMLTRKETQTELRGLLNLEWDEERLLSLVLSGLPELEQTLALDPPLAERVDIRVELACLDAGSASAYLAHRVRTAGGDPGILHPEATARIAELSEGIPRRLNTLADNALFEAYLAARRQVSVEDVDRAAQDLSWARKPEPEPAPVEAPPAPAPPVFAAPAVPQPELVAPPQPAPAPVQTALPAAMPSAPTPAPIPAAPAVAVSPNAVTPSAPPAAPTVAPPASAPEAFAPAQPHASVPPPAYEPVQAPPVPVQPAPPQPVHPAPAQPVHPAPPQPVHPAPPQPVQPAPAQPVHPAPAQPVHPAPAQPVQPAPAQPPAAHPVQAPIPAAPAPTPAPNVPTAPAHAPVVAAPQTAATPPAAPDTMPHEPQAPVAPPPQPVVSPAPPVAPQPVVAAPPAVATPQPAVPPQPAPPPAAVPSTASGLDADETISAEYLSSVAAEVQAVLGEEPDLESAGGFALPEEEDEAHGRTAVIPDGGLGFDPFEPEPEDTSPDSGSNFNDDSLDHLFVNLVEKD